MNEIIPFSQLEKIAQSTDLYPVDFDEAWQWMGYSRKDAALRVLQDNFEEGTEYTSLNRKVKRKDLISLNIVEPNKNVEATHGASRLT